MQQALHQRIPEWFQIKEENIGASESGGMCVTFREFITGKWGSSRRFQLVVSQKFGILDCVHRARDSPLDSWRINAFNANKEPIESYD